MDASEAADLAALQAMAAEGQAPAGETPEPDPAGQVEAMFRPCFAMLAATGPKNAAFYTPAQARVAAESFTVLAEAEGWDLQGLESKWFLRIAFLMTVTPPHALEIIIGRIMAFAVPKARQGDEKPAGEAERRADQ